MFGDLRWAKRLGELAMGVGCVLAVAGVAIAQENPAPDPHADKSSWVLGYALVVLAIALGLVAVCRPGSRSKDIKVEKE